MKTVTLYRPVGQREFELITESGYTAFPPRLPEQPIFYPVVNREYAERIAAIGIHGTSALDLSAT